MTDESSADTRSPPLAARAFHHPLVRYLSGLAMAAGAFGLRLLLAPWTGKGAPFVLFFAATLVTTLIAGAGPGLLVLLTSLPVAAVTFAIPAGATPAQAAFQTLLYVIDGLIIIHLTRRAQQAQRRLHQANRDLREATATLQGSEAHTREIIELSPDAYFQANLAGRFVDVNEAACRQLGYTRDELLSKTIRDVIPPEDAGRLAEIRDVLRTPGATHTGEWTHLRKDGVPVLVDVSANILPDGRWQAFARDIGERKRAEAERLRTTERLRQSEEQFRLMFEEAPIGAAMAALDGRFLRVNRALCEILGYTAAELERLSYQEITPPEELAASFQMRDRIYRGEAERYRLEKHYLRKDGTKVDISVNGSIVFDRDGQPLHYIAQIEDITDRKRAEEALRQSELKFRQLVESMPDGVFIFQADRIVYANRRVGALLGYEDETALLGRSILELVAPEGIPLVQSRIRYVMETGKIAPPQEVPLVRRDGGLASVETVGIGAQFEGAPAIVVVARDITERVRAEHEQRILAEVGVALAATLDYERTLTTIAQISVEDFADWCMVEVTETNDTLRRLKIASADPAKTALADELARYRIDQRRPYLLRPVVESGQSLLIPRVTPKDIEAAAQSPEHFALLRALEPTSVVAVPLRLREQLLGTLTFVSSKLSRRYGATDLRFAKALAERAALAIENARLYRAAVQATRMRDQVLGVVAHDLRNPLSTITLHTSALRRPKGEPEQRNQRHKEAIERATRRMTRLIQDLLDAATLEEGRLSVEKAPLSSADLVGEAVLMQQALAAAGSIELCINLAPEVPKILGDRDRLLQVFENLIGNALKFTEAGGRVTVGAAPGESGALFWVADTGRGMTPDEVAHIFDRFWQASARSGRLGAGLGLPITKGIVEAHGGRIWAESKPGEGSVFFFVIPAAAPAPAEAGVTIH